MIEPQVTALNAAFCRFTGNRCTLSYARKLSWTQFIERGFTEADLELVIRWLKAQIARGEGGFSPLSLQFGALLGDVDKFEDRLNVARQSRHSRTMPSESRIPKPEPVAALSPEQEEQLRSRAKGLGAEVRRTLEGRG
jgi:hypothetical protein